MVAGGVMAKNGAGSRRCHGGEGLRRPNTGARPKDALGRGRVPLATPRHRPGLPVHGLKGGTQGCPGVEEENGARPLELPPEVLLQFPLFLL